MLIGFIMKILMWAGILSVFLVLFIIVIYRPWAINWGATEIEIKRAMPGDKIVANPTFNATRAVTIQAQPEEIWPWIVQIGYQRAGFYSYDRLDNDGIPSSKKIIPEYQSLKIGDKIPVSASTYTEVIDLNPNQSMVLQFQNCGVWTNSTWAWELYKESPECTRLLTRLRVPANNIIFKTALELIEIFMMRKCMLGVKQRAERLATSDEHLISNKGWISSK
jgi:hypothetical protein